MPQESMDTSKPSNYYLNGARTYMYMQRMPMVKHHTKNRYDQETERLRIYSESIAEKIYNLVFYSP